MISSVMSYYDSAGNLINVAQQVMPPTFPVDPPPPSPKPDAPEPTATAPSSSSSKEKEEKEEVAKEDKDHTPPSQHSDV
jgi:hypothetical protein